MFFLIKAGGRWAIQVFAIPQDFINGGAQVLSFIVSTLAFCNGVKLAGDNR